MFLRTLSNGLEVLVVEDNSVPLATITMTFKAGAFTESAYNNGLTGIYTSMFLTGDKEYPNEISFHYHLGQLGIISHYSTTDESSACYFTLPKFNLEEGLKIMNSAIRFSTISKLSLEKEKEMTKDQLKQKESNPNFALYNVMFRHLWGDLFYRKRAIGSNETINSASVELLEEIKNKYFYPNNALLVIGGDVEHVKVFDQVEKIYGGWTASNFDPFKKWSVPEFETLSKTVYFIVESSLSQSPFISIYWQGPDTRNDIPSTYAADVFSYIVNQKESKFNLALVQSGLALSVNAGYLTAKHIGPISLTIEPNPAKIDECMREVRKQIGLMDSDDYLSDEQIENARRMLSIKKIREEEITSDYVRTLSFWWASASINYFINYDEKLDKISRADIKSYVNKYIKDKPYCAGLLINPDLEKQLTADTFFKKTN